MSSIALIGPIGPLEIGIILLIVLVIFGPKRLPELGKSLGEGMRGFKDSVTGKDKDDDPDELERPAKVDASAEEPSSERTREPAQSAGDARS